MDSHFWQSLLSDYTLRTVALGSTILGIVSGTLGSFAMLRRQSLLGDAVSHSALPGIALAFLLTRSKEPIILILGAAVAGWMATLFIQVIISKCRLKTDSAMGLVLSVFFGFGLVLLTFIQKLPDSRQAGLESFLFGQASAMLHEDVITMGLLGGMTLVFVCIFWKEFKLLSFDPDFGRSMGVSMRLADFILTTLLVVAIVIGLQTVGVVLMSAMVVAPAAAARQWSDKLHIMVLLSGLFGALAGVSGAVISSLTTHLPTGPTIVVCISAIVLASMLAAPNRGLLSNRLRQFRHRRQVRLEAVLADLYELAQQHASSEYPHSVAALRAMNPLPESVPESLRQLSKRGFARKSGHDQWSLTERGIVEAKRLLHSEAVR
jgi:manganese/zinc/iron transport system permease protein